MKRRLWLVMSLSFPSIVAQLSAVVMEYIDAAMVGSLGANDSASIGLVATSTWLFFGLCSAFSAGFTVQVAHRLGAGNRSAARSVMRQGMTSALIFSLIVGAIGVAVSGPLPGWLGGSPAITHNATLYFRVFSMALPVIMFSFMTGGLLRCSGNTLVPGVMGVVMCVLDVMFNFMLIFPTREMTLLGMSWTMPGAGLGVWGAALGTGLAEAVTTLSMFIYLWYRGGELRLSGRTDNSFRVRKDTLRRAFSISWPIGMERFVTSAAQITITVIVAPLGACSIAANAFAVTAESLCYMPGYGIADAAQTLTGQSLGAGNRKLARSFGNLTVAIGIAVMTVMGVIMYAAAPLMIGLMSPVKEIVDLGVEALRIEAWAEPMFAASIVSYGVFVGAGDTVVPCIMNLASMWLVRITLAALLAPTMGLAGVWLAMCIELSFRGVIFLWRLKGDKWMAAIKSLGVNNQ